MSLSEEKQEWLGGLTVAKLRTELKARGLNQNGVKADLQARLKEFLLANEEGAGDDTTGAASPDQAKEPEQAAPSTADEPPPAEEEAPKKPDKSAKKPSGKAAKQSKKALPADEEQEPPAAAPEPEPAGRATGRKPSRKSAPKPSSPPAPAEEDPPKHEESPAAKDAAQSPTEEQQQGKAEGQPAAPAQEEQQPEVRKASPARDPSPAPRQAPPSPVAAVHEQEEVDYGLDSEDHQEHQHADEEDNTAAAPATAEITPAAEEKPAGKKAAAASKPAQATSTEPSPRTASVTPQAAQETPGSGTAAGLASQPSEDGAKRSRRAPIVFQPKAKQLAAEVAPAEAEAHAATPAATDAAAPKPKVSGKGAAAAAATAAAPPPSRQASGAAPPASVPVAAARTPSAAVPLPEGPATQALRIDNLVRPFTENNLRQLISETGKIVDMWMPSIKTHAFVILEGEEQGAATCAALHGASWPQGSHKRLKVTYLSVEEAQEGIAQGRDPGYKPVVVRTTSLSARLQVPAAAAPAAPAQATAMDVDSPPVAPAKGGDAGKARVHSSNGASSSPEREGSGRPDAAEAAGAEVAPSAKPSAATAAAAAGEPAAAKPVAKVGLGAVAAAKAAMAAAAGEGSKRRRSASRDGSAGDEPRAKRPHVAPAQQAAPEEKVEEAVLSLDTLFCKTAAKPHLYWLPLTDEQVTAKKARIAREEEMQQKLEQGHKLPLAQRYPHLSGLAGPPPMLDAGRRR